MDLSAPALKDLEQLKTWCAQCIQADFGFEVTILTFDMTDGALHGRCQRQDDRKYYFVFPEKSEHPTLQRLAARSRSLMNESPHS